MSKGFYQMPYPVNEEVRSYEPNSKELESLICIKCEKVKINLKIFPKTPPEPFWTKDKNYWQPKFNWIVNFLNGNTFGRYPGYKPNYIRLVRDRN